MCDGDCLPHLWPKVFPQINIPRICYRADAAWGTYRSSTGRTLRAARNLDTNYERHGDVQPTDWGRRRKILSSNDWEWKGSRVSVKLKGTAEQATWRTQSEGWNKKAKTYKIGCSNTAARVGAKRIEAQGRTREAWKITQKHWDFSLFWILILT